MPSIVGMPFSFPRSSKGVFFSKVGYRRILQIFFYGWICVNRELSVELGA
jgi:hypothetical protein